MALEAWMKTATPDEEFDMTELPSVGRSGEVSGHNLFCPAIGKKHGLTEF